MSIVLPTYNRGKTLKRAIDSVLNQTFNDFELIIVDDRSTDDTHKVLREYGGNNQIRVVSRFDKTGLFDESLPRFIDLELFIRLSDHFEFFHYKKPLVKMFASDGISTNHRWLVLAREYLIGKYRDRLEQQKHHLVAQYLQRARDMTQIAALGDRVTDKQARIAALADRVSDKQAQIAALADQVADKQSQIAALGDQVADKQSQVAALGAQLSDKQAQIAALGAQLSGKQAQIAALGAQLSAKRAEIEKITKSLGWRLLSRYGPIKYRYLLPIYCLLGGAPTVTDESEATKPKGPLRT